MPMPFFSSLLVKLRVNMPGSGSLRLESGSQRPVLWSQRPGFVSLRLGLGSLRPGFRSLRPEPGSRKPESWSQKSRSGSQRLGCGFQKPESQIKSNQAVYFPMGLVPIERLGILCYGGGPYFSPRHPSSLQLLNSSPNFWWASSWWPSFLCDCLMFQYKNTEVQKKERKNEQ